MLPPLYSDQRYKFRHQLHLQVEMFHDKSNIYSGRYVSGSQKVNWKKARSSSVFIVDAAGVLDNSVSTVFDYRNRSITFSECQL